VLNICFKELFVLLIPLPVFALLAENMAYLTEKCDEYKDPAIYNEYPCEYLNLSAVYMLSALAASQSMNKVGFAFKNLKNAQLIMSKRFPTLEGLAAEHEHVSGTPYITRQTVAYAISLTVSALFYAVHDESNKGRADEVYDKALRDLEQLSDAKFDECLGDLLQFYVRKVTSPEPLDFGTSARLDKIVALAVANVELPVASGPASDSSEPVPAEIRPDAPAEDSDSSVSKSSSGSDNESAAKTNSASPGKGGKKAGGRGRPPRVRGGAR
jgi:hypothetical protein